MAITSGFFNSVSGDRTYNAEDMTRYFEGLVSPGVFANPSNNLQVTSTGDSMNVSVQPGRGIIDCHWFKNDSAYSFTITAADALLNRIDAIVMRYVVSERKIILALKTGTPATNPVAPVMLRTADTMEYCLATIAVNKGVTQISQANITDTRADRTVCGWITNLINNIDITALYAQWQTAFNEQLAAFDQYMQTKEAAFDAWYSQLTESLQVVTTVKKYESSYTTTAATTTFPVNVSDYVYGDAIIVHLGGVLLREGVDYTLSGKNVNLTSSVPAGRTYTCIVFKSAIGNEELT